jgi:hypothetical protein
LKSLGFWKGLPINGKWSSNLYVAIRKLEVLLYLPASSPGTINKETLSWLGVNC